ncbi:MAG: type IV pili methyl-accepting chemotaxis transducer N-terminal domain-containing protein [Filomicrobium sp.]
MGNVFRFSILFCFLGCVLLPVSSAVADAEITARKDGGRKINLSGRQRMLTQFMSKATCFAAASLDVERHKNSIASTHWLFETTLRGLRHGDKIQGMLPETHEAVLAKLSEVEELWAKLGPAVTAARDSGFKDGKALDVVYEFNTPTLKSMNEAVSVIEKTYGDGAVDAEIAAALNVSGRQRMLTQKASKEFCYIVSGTDVEANRGNLKKTVALFNQSLAALINGKSEINIPKPPVGEIFDQLSIVQKLWQPLNSVFQKVADGATPTAEETRIILDGNEPVLKAMNRAVSLYEGIL